MPADAVHYEEIRVYGDATYDTLERTTPDRSHPFVERTTEGRKRYPRKRMSFLPGGSLLLLDMIREAATAAGLSQSIVIPEASFPHLPQETTTESQQEPSPLGAPNPVAAFVPHSHVLLRPDDDGKHFFVKSLEGFFPPYSEGKEMHIAEPNVDAGSARALYVVDGSLADLDERVIDTISDQDLVIVRVRSARHAGLPRALQTDGCRSILPIFRAEDLRGLEAVRISHALSWERTVCDLLTHMIANAELAFLQSYGQFIVLFGIEGALLYRASPDPNATLFFDPNFLEGQYDQDQHGIMIGMTTAFVAGLSVMAAHRGLEHLDSDIKKALTIARRLRKNGFVLKDNGQVAYPLKEAFCNLADDDPLADPVFSSIRVPISTPQEEHEHWTILGQRTRDNLYQVACRIVVDGTEQGLAQLRVPIGRFGQLRTVDRFEIESYSAIRNLIAGYLDAPDPTRPLSLAVFGPAGAGKSFGVLEVAQSVSSQVAALECNLSQLHSPRDLGLILHRARDTYLRGKIPFLFFDEFDSSLGAAEFGWLRCFLAPMHDGKFLDEGGEHPIGPAIFVFAGGTCESFEYFDSFRGSSGVSREDSHLITDETAKNDDETEAREHVDGGEPSRERVERFKEAKGPDFISRLSGFINIMGPNRRANVSSRHDADSGFIIRRALVLRHELDYLKEKAPGLFGDKDYLNIDYGVLRALLMVPEYYHGGRSIGAIASMSNLANRRRFDQAALPSKRQLQLHVDAGLFLFMAERERFTHAPTTERELIDQLCTHCFDIHKQWILARGAELKCAFVATAEVVRTGLIGRDGTVRIDEGATFNQLTAAQQELYRQAVQDVPRRLGRQGLGIRNIADQDRVPRFPALEIENIQSLAGSEHDDVTVDPLALAIPAILRDANYEIFRIAGIDALQQEHLLKILVEEWQGTSVVKKKEEELLRTALGKGEGDIKLSVNDVVHGVLMKLEALRLGKHRVRAATGSRREEEDDNKMQQLQKRCSKIEYVSELIRDATQPVREQKEAEVFDQLHNEAQQQYAVRYDAFVEWLKGRGFVIEPYQYEVDEGSA